MNKMRKAGVGVLLLSIQLMALAGCASTKLAFDKPGVATADLERDQNACLRTAVVTESASILAPTIDRDDLIRCMEKRGYTAVYR